MISRNRSMRNFMNQSATCMRPDSWARGRAGTGTKFLNPVMSVAWRDAQPQRHRDRDRDREMVGHVAGVVRLTGQDTDGTPRLKFKQTKAALHRQVWLQQQAQTARARERETTPRTDFVHVGGVSREKQQQEQQGETAPNTARASSPLSKTRPATALGYGPQPRLAPRRPTTAPEPSSQRPTARSRYALSADTGSQAGPERYSFSPRSPRGSRSNGQVWIDRRSPRNRRQDGARTIAVAGHRWVGCAETRWKAMASTAGSTARTHATRQTERHIHSERQAVVVKPRPVQTPGMQMEGFRPHLHGRQTIGHPLHTASSPFNRSLGRGVALWKQSHVSYSGCNDGQAERHTEAHTEAQRSTERHTERHAETD